MAKERCRVCGKKVEVQIQKNTGYCCAKCQESDWSPHDRRGRLDRSVCDLCAATFVECSKCGYYFCDCTRSETCEGAPAQ